jgi:DNA-binding response OmpR family regulator
MILVVDDDKDLVRTLTRIITKEGYKVQTAPSGVEAYELVKQSECKCMLLDINMPKLNGAELLMLMQDDGLDIPTIVMAGFDDFDEQEFMGFESVVGFMHKPFETADVVSAIKKHALK